MRCTTEFLAQQLAGPETARPDWSALEWDVARAVSAMHGISALLATGLSWHGPRSWQHFLADQTLQIARRHLRMQTLLVELNDRAQASGVALVALKGAALYARGLYRDGLRPMADLDLLVRGAQLKLAADVLGELGFRQCFVSPRERIFIQGSTRAAPLGEHADNPLKIDLHEHVAEYLPRRRIDLTAQILSDRLQPGVNPYRSSAALMAHLLLHAAGAMINRSLRILHLQDIALLAAQMSDADWQELQHDTGPVGSDWWPAPPLQVTARYHRDERLRGALRFFSTRTPRTARWLMQRWRITDLSLSNPRIYAFPGIEWSSSVADAAQYAWQRLRPDAQLLAQREYLASTAIPLASSSWSTLSQQRRILRWLTRRPLRPDTLHAVGAVGAALTSPRAGGPRAG
ncbi:MAG: nucleotidyltransferase family protein [Sinobacteraceae bacterium]|nr:nucleotidyltransferase family protein [Nevskiaceae bacterium]